LPEEVDVKNFLMSTTISWIDILSKHISYQYKMYMYDIMCTEAKSFHPFQMNIHVIVMKEKTFLMPKLFKTCHGFFK
jgi:hypothetical protein